MSTSIARFPPSSPPLGNVTSTVPGEIPRTLKTPSYALNANGIGVWKYDESSCNSHVKSSNQSHPKNNILPPLSIQVPHYDSGSGPLEYGRNHSLQPLPKQNQENQGKRDDSVNEEIDKLVNCKKLAVKPNYIPSHDSQQPEISSTILPSALNGNKKMKIGAEPVRLTKKVLGITWNLHRCIPSATDFLKLISSTPSSSSTSVNHDVQLRDADILFVGVQEAGSPRKKKVKRIKSTKVGPLPDDFSHSKARGVAPITSDPIKPWYRVVESVLDRCHNLSESEDGDKYVFVEFVKLMSIQAAIFVKQSCAKLISSVNTYKLPTGIMNVIGNKGAVGIAINFAHLSGMNPHYDACTAKYLFINSHFQAHKHKIKQRNNDYKRIKSKLVRSANVSRKRGKSQYAGATDMQISESRIKTSAADVTNNYDFVMWLGDFNYRY